MKKILAVDDEPGVLTCIKASLEKCGYEVFTTTDPAATGPILDAHPIDLLTLDIRMPKISGLQVYQELRRRQHKSIPVLFITAYANTFSSQSEEMMKMWVEEFSDGNTDILYKPFKFAALIEKVESLIGRPGDSEE